MAKGFFNIGSGLLDRAKSTFKARAAAGGKAAPQGSPLKKAIQAKLVGGNKVKVAGSGKTGDQGPGGRRSGLMQKAIGKAVAKKQRAK